MQNKQKFITFLLFIITAISSTNSLATIVRMEFMFGSNPGGEVFIELLDQGTPEQQTPKTVTNFLNYIENANSTPSRRYDGTIIHRSIANFVVQGGGFLYDPLLGEFNDTSVTHIERDAPVINEFDPSRSNLRGTVAMAKLKDAPNSATSEWFFNLSDNLVLDTQNEGFTVFGKVLDPGMDTIDVIAALPTISDVFSNLPVTDYILSLPVTEENLVTIQPSVYLSGYPIDFGKVDVFTAPTQSVTILNSETGDLLIGQFDLSSVQAPFSAIDNCSNITLEPLAECTVDIVFSPTSEGDFDTTVSAPISTGITPIDFTVNASAAFSSADLTLLTRSPGVINDSRRGVTGTGVINIRNDGIGNDDTAVLQITGYNFTGQDAALFAVSNLCTRIVPGSGCTEGITFLSPNTGDFSATLEILSNDPDSPVTTIELIASASEDNDGIKDSVELAAPNGGDNNKDGIPDNLQEYVASFPDFNGKYFSLVTDQSILLTRVKATQFNPSLSGLLPVDPNSTITFPYGFFEFNLENIPADGKASATLILPEDEQLPEFVTYYKYRRPLFFLASELWFPFDIRSPLVSGTGAEFNGNQVTLHFIDGAPGDIDITPNGTIVDPGGIAVLTPTIPASSIESSGGCTLQHEQPSINKHLEWLLLLCGFIFYPLSRQSTNLKTFKM